LATGLGIEAIFNLLAPKEQARALVTSLLDIRVNYNNIHSVAPMMHKFLAKCMPTFQNLYDASCGLLDRMELYFQYTPIFVLNAIRTSDFKFGHDLGLLEVISTEIRRSAKDFQFRTVLKSARRGWQSEGFFPLPETQLKYLSCMQSQVHPLPEFSL